MFICTMYQGLRANVEIQQAYFRRERLPRLAQESVFHSEEEPVKRETHNCKEGEEALVGQLMTHALFLNDKILGYMHTSKPYAAYKIIVENEGRECAPAGEWRMINPGLFFFFVHFPFE